MPFLEIHFAGGTDTDWSEWFQGRSITPVSSNEMCLCCEVADHSAIYGILSTLSSLRIKLISVTVKEEPEVPQDDLK